MKSKWAFWGTTLMVLSIYGICVGLFKLGGIPAELIQGWIAAINIPVCLYFIRLLGKRAERWWTTWFGVSLMYIALHLLVYSTSVVLFRVFGEYPGRDYMLLLSPIIAITAMATRSYVLWASQRQENAHMKRHH